MTIHRQIDFRKKSLDNSGKWSRIVVATANVARTWHAKRRMVASAIVGTLRIAGEPKAGTCRNTVSPAKIGTSK